MKFKLKMKRIEFKYAILILTLHFLIVQSVFSQMILDSSDTSISENETTILSVILKNEKTKDFNIQGIENFEIMSQSQQKSTQIINGKMSSSIVYQYTILPKLKGNFDLKALSKTTESNSLRIEVSGADNSNLNNENKDFYVESNLDKGTYYFGEKIVLDEHLITTVNIKNFGFVEPASFKDFSQEEFTDKNFDAKYTRVNGKKAIDYTVYKGVLEPLTSGVLTIPSRTLQLSLLQGESFLSNTVSKFLKTREKKITVIKLPSNQPKNFSGIVGTFTMDSKYDRSSVSLGEAVTLDVKIKGNGNTDPLEKIVASNIQNFKIYENIKNSDESVSNNGYYSEKEFEVIFIPQKVGKIKIPEIKIPYFNTESKDYDFLTIPEAELIVENDGSVLKNNLNSTVVPNEGLNDSVSSSKPSENSYITISQMEPESRNKDDKIFNKKNFIILAVITVFSLAFNVFGVLVPGIKRRKANKVPSNIKEIIKALKRDEDLDKIFLYFNEGLKLKYGINIKSMSCSQIYSYFDNYNPNTLKEINQTEKSKLEMIIKIKKEWEDFKFLNKRPDIFRIKDLKKEITEIIS